MRCKNHIDRNKRPKTQIVPGRKIAYIVGHQKVRFGLEKLSKEQYERTFKNFPKATKAFIYKSQLELKRRNVLGESQDIGLLIVDLLYASPLGNQLAYLQLPHIPDGLVFTQSMNTEIEYIFLSRCCI